MKIIKFDYLDVEEKSLGVFISKSYFIGFISYSKRYKSYVYTPETYDTITLDVLKEIIKRINKCKKGLK